MVDLVLRFARSSGLRMPTKSWHRICNESTDHHARYVVVNDKMSDLRKHFRSRAAEQDEEATKLLAEFRAPSFAFASEICKDTGPELEQRALRSAINTARALPHDAEQQLAIKAWDALQDPEATTDVESSESARSGGHTADAPNFPTPARLRGAESPLLRRRL